MKTNRSVPLLSLILGVLTFVILAGKLAILNIIEPTPSGIDVIGNSVKELITSIEGKERPPSISQKRDIWNTVLTITGVVFFIMTIAISYKSIKQGNKVLSYAAIALALLGVILYFSKFT